MSSGAGTSVRPKPRLRGVVHLCAAIAAVPATIVLVLHATTELQMGALAYGLSLVCLLATSATYHTPHWTPEKRMMMRRADRSMIYLLIAGSYTPFFLAIGDGAPGHVLPVIYALAALGIVVSLFWVRAPRQLVALLYVTLGWFAIFYTGEMLEELGSPVVGLILIGGCFYTAGAVVYAKRWPDPAPRTFGYHEIFHVAVVLASICHYIGVWRVVA